MGKLIYHGEELTGVARKALQIIYDNTNSGLSADNAQDAIDEVSAAQKLKTITTTANTSYISGSDWHFYSKDGKIISFGYFQITANIVSGVNLFTMTTNKPTFNQNLCAINNSTGVAYPLQYYADTGKILSPRDIPSGFYLIS